jgi:hypothetical protein
MRTKNTTFTHLRRKRGRKREMRVRERRWISKCLKLLGIQGWELSSSDSLELSTWQDVIEGLRKST